MLAIIQRTVRGFLAVFWSPDASGKRQSDPDRLDEISKWIASHPDEREKSRIGAEQIRQGRSRTISRRGTKS